MKKLTLEPNKAKGGKPNLELRSKSDSKVDHELKGNNIENKYPYSSIPRLT